MFDRLQMKDTMSKKLVKVFCLAGLTLAISACNPILRTHGYIPTDEKPQEVEVQSDTKASVLARLGNPSMKVSEYTVEDGRYVNYSDRKTPTRGRELSALEQIFGTIGRLPTEQIGGQRDIPGGSGGPGGG